MGKYIKGENRKQLILYRECLDEIVEEENEVRVIDLYVESIKLEEIGFKKYEPNKKERIHMIQEIC